ncbi:hypothetical protein C8R45DRAFT_1102726 [Mycena sanguinolenta]|nr:hypothetical protein C8R45DRAFT_1102726 [Mycena sanguinolenta]
MFTVHCSLLPEYVALCRMTSTVFWLWLQFSIISVTPCLALEGSLVIMLTIRGVWVLAFDSPGLLSPSMSPVMCSVVPAGVCKHGDIVSGLRALVSSLPPWLVPLAISRVGCPSVLIL